MATSVIKAVLSRSEFEAMGGLAIDVAVTIPSNGWSVSAPHTYTWTNSAVTTGAYVDVSFAEGAEDVSIVYLEYEKVTGGVRFTIDEVPSENIPVVIHISHVSSDFSITGEDVATDVITGATNVDEALEILNQGGGSSYGGARIVTATTTVTNVSGSYSNTVEDENITEEMIAFRLEIGTPSVFDGDITITPGTGEYTVACPIVSGTSTLKIFFIKREPGPPQVTSDEFDILNNRLLAVENVITNTPVTIATTDWMLSNGVYSYTWESSLVTTNCGIEVTLQNGAESAGISGFDYEKVTGGIKLTTTETPSGNLPVVMAIINAKSNGIQSLTADDISSEAITGCNTVEDALEDLDTRASTISTSIGTVPSGKTLQGEVDTLNSNIETISTKLNGLLKEETYNNLTINPQAAGIAGISAPTGKTYPVCVSQVGSSSYRFGGFFYYGTWWVNVFNNSNGAPVAASTNLGTVKVIWI